jgi:hypothetical protein
VSGKTELQDDGGIRADQVRCIDLTGLQFADAAVKRRVRCRPVAGFCGDSGLQYRYACPQRVDGRLEVVCSATTCRRTLRGGRSGLESERTYKKTHDGSYATELHSVVPFSKVTVDSVSLAVTGEA